MSNAPERGYFQYDDDAVVIGLYYREGGTAGEFVIKWDYRFSPVIPKLCAYEDSWSVLPQFQDLFDELAAFDRDDREQKVPRPMTQEYLIEILKKLGIVDTTNWP